MGRLGNWTASPFVHLSCSSHVCFLTSYNPFAQAFNRHCDFKYRDLLISRHPNTANILPLCGDDHDCILVKQTTGDCFELVAMVAHRSNCDVIRQNDGTM